MEICQLAYGLCGVTDVTTLEKVIECINDKLYVDAAYLYGANIIAQLSTIAKQKLIVILKIGINFDQDNPFCKTSEEFLYQYHEFLRIADLPRETKIICLIHRTNGENVPTIIEAFQQIRSENPNVDIGFSEVNLEQYLYLETELHNAGLKINYLENAFNIFVQKNRNVISYAQSRGVKILTYTSLLRGLLKPGIMNISSDLSAGEIQQEVFKAVGIDGNNIEKSVGFYQLDVIKKNLTVVQEYLFWCESNGLNPCQVALKYSIDQGFIPIFGAGVKSRITNSTCTGTSNIELCMEATNIELSEDFDAKAIDWSQQFTGYWNPLCLNRFDQEWKPQ